MFEQYPKNGYYIDTNGDYTPIPYNSKRTTYRISKPIVKLVVPDGIKTVRCTDNFIEELIIPDGVVELYCWGNKLTELFLPKSITTLLCSRNQIKKLVLPKNFEWVDCCYNQIDDLIIPNGSDHFVRHLYSYSNCKHIKCDINALNSSNILNYDYISITLI